MGYFLTSARFLHKSRVRLEGVLRGNRRCPLKEGVRGNRFAVPPMDAGGSRRNIFKNNEQLIVISLIYLLKASLTSYIPWEPLCAL